ncbi:release factor glutamine methyltransferase [Pancytospora philotis]|nr:release factor glutamine methyltransferase [Pancytospora philotis]
MDWYEPDEDTYTLIDALAGESIRGKVVVDLGCSTGAITKVLENDNFVISVDLNAKALYEMRRMPGKQMCRSMLCADLLSAIRQSSVDVVVFNPPYVPDYDCPILGGGPDGRVVIDRFIAAVCVPTVYLLVIEANKPREVVAALQERGYRSEVLKIRKIIGETIIIIKATRAAAAPPGQ